MRKLISRFQKFTKADYIALISIFLVLILGLYFSISFSVKISQGYTLFGDSSNYNPDEIETVTTSADLIVLAFFWILTILLFSLFIYQLFFKKITHKEVKRKEIVDGKTVTINEDDKRRDQE